MAILINVLLLRKGVYPYEYMDRWERFNELSIPPKEAFYSESNLEDITDEDYAHVQKVRDVFKIKNRGVYHNLYVQSDTLFVADVFENFRDKCIKIYELDPAHFLSAPGLAWQACLKKTDVELELLTDIDMLLMVEKGIREGICQAIYRYAKANNKYMNNYDKIKITSYLMYLDANTLCGWAISQKHAVTGFKWVEDLSQFNEHFIKNYEENSNKGYVLEVDIEYPKKLFSFHKDFLFLPERKKIWKCEKFVCSIEDKEKYVIHKSFKASIKSWFKTWKCAQSNSSYQQAWLNPYIHMNTDLRCKKRIWKRFL